MNLKRYEEAADQFGHAIDKAPSDKQAGLRDLRRQCLSAEPGAAPSSEAAGALASPKRASTQNGPPLQEIEAWIASNIPPRIDTPGKPIESQSQEISFTGCTATFKNTLVKYKNFDRPPNKRGLSTTMIDLSKLTPDAVGISSQGPWVTLHSQRGFPQHVRDWILSTDAILRHETEPDELSEDDETPTDWGFFAQDNDLAARLAHAWRDAITKCTAQSVPSNLY